MHYGSHRYPRIPFTCTSGVHDELSHFKGVSFNQSFPKHLHLTGVSDLRLAHHDLEWAVGHVFSILLHADHMLTHLFRSEGYSWRQRAMGMSSLFRFIEYFMVAPSYPTKKYRPQGLALHQKLSFELIVDSLWNRRKELLVSNRVFWGKHYRRHLIRKFQSLIADTVLWKTS